MDAVLHVDGGSRGNPGPSGVGVVMKDKATGAVVHKAGYFLGRMTNNVAEYTGLLRGLEVAKDLGVERLEIRSDSQLMVEQVSGRWKVKHDNLKGPCGEARMRLKGFKWAGLTYVPREQNREADGLANEAMDKPGDVVYIDRGKVVAGAKAAPSAAATSSAVSAKPQGAEEAMKLPCFSVLVRGKNATCHAGTGVGTEHTFGPTTPDGACLHAAAAALSDGPLQWPAGKRLGDTRCGACGLNIQMHRLV